MTLTVIVALTLIELSIDPAWLNQFNIMLFSVLHFFVGAVIAILVGFRASGKMKSQLDDLSVMIMQLSRGNYHSRFHMEEEDEVARIGTELNDLAKDRKSTRLKSSHVAISYAVF